MGVTPSGSVHFCDQYREFQLVDGTIEELDQPSWVDGCVQIDFDSEGNRFAVGRRLPYSLGYNPESYKRVYKNLCEVPNQLPDR